MTTTLLNHVEKHDYQRLFIEHLRWSRPDQPAVTVSLEGSGSFEATNVSSYKGLRVWVCAELPGSSEQAAVDRAIAKKSTDRLVIFHNDNKQVWRWPARTTKTGAVSTRLTSHIHVAGQDNPKLLKRLEAITLGVTEDLSVTEVVERVRQAFDVETEKETKRASKLMASMYKALEEVGTHEHDISVTLARILFLMFGDDTDMWNRDLFHNFIVKHTRTDGEDLAVKLNELFVYVDTKPEARGVTPEHLTGFKYINGGLFRERVVLPAVGETLRAAILSASSSNWADISPAIFGSMFQSVRDAQTRREFGEHYTSEKDILKTLNPLFLDELREEYAHAIGHREEYSLLNKLRNRLGRIKFLDPACGCGNFMIIAYRELRLLEITILERIRLKEATRTVSLAPNQLEFGLEGEIDAAGMSRTTLLDPVVMLSNFYGIEIDEWPAKIAETAMFLIDRQCDVQMLERLGFAPERLPIQQQANILTTTADDPNGGNSLRLNWFDLFQPDEDSIVAGNPPFIGMSLMSSGQQEDNRLAFAPLATSGLRTGRLDYVACWYARTIAFLKGTKGRAAFVSTNSITQGEQARTLQPLLKHHGFEVNFGHRPFKWSSEAPGSATVHVVIIGFSERGRVERKRLFEYPDIAGSPIESDATNLNFYLIDGTDDTPTKRYSPLIPGMPNCTKGSQPTDGGHLFLKTPEALTEAMADPIASKYVSRFVGSEEMLWSIDRWCLWLADASPADLNSSDFLRNRLKLVDEARSKSPTRSVREANTPALFTQRRQPNLRYLALPKVSSENRDYIPMKYFNPDVIAGDAILTMENVPQWLFALLQAKPFTQWAKTFAGRLESRLQILPGTVYFTFPFPALDHDQKEELEEGARAILTARVQFGDRSLGALYDPLTMPHALRDAHKQLDFTVDNLYGLNEPTDAQRMKAMLQRYSLLNKAASTK